MKNTGNQAKNSKPKHPTDHLQAFQYKKGQSGNPSGRPKGSKSLKEYAKEMLASMTDEEREEFLHGLPKIEIWRMSEGNPKQDTELRTPDGLKIEFASVFNQDVNTPRETNQDNTIQETL